MKPFLYYSPDFSIPSFAFMLMLASLVSTSVAYVMAPRRGFSQVVVLDLAMIGTIMALVGGRLFHVFVEEFAYYRAHPSHVYQIWRGGFVSYGGFLGLGLGWFVYLNVRKLDVLGYLDHVILFAGPFIDFFVRLGCLMAGCCYGKPSPFHSGKYLLYIVFNDRRGDAGSKFLGVPLWPTQIYSLIAAATIFLLCYAIDRRKKFKGQVTLCFLMFYAVLRSAIELLRGDAERGVYFNNSVSTAQIMSGLFFLTCVGCYFYFRKRFPVAPQKAVVSAGPEPASGSEPSA